MEGWRYIAQTYVMEWQMVWKDIVIGFTVAGIIAAFVPDSFFQALFPGAGGESGEATKHWELVGYRPWPVPLLLFLPSSGPWEIFP